MATLQFLTWGGRSFDMWSWTMGKVHLTARTTPRRIRDNIYLATLGPRGGEPTHTVVAKMARNPEEMYALEREAEFYANDLKDLQGIAVPHYFGFFRCKDNGVDIGCLLLEYCTGVDPFTAEELEEFCQAKMMAMCSLHKAGVKHGDLARGTHFVKMGNGVRIIDFSSAIRHACQNAYPVITNPGWRGKAVPQCDELALVERICGYRVDRAVRQYHRYFPTR